MRKAALQARSGGDQEIEEQLEKDFQLKKLLVRKNDEQKKIQRAQERWAFVRKKIKVIRQIGNMTGSDV